MKIVSISLFIIAFFTLIQFDCEIYAQDCNKQEAQAVIDQITKSGMAERQDSPGSITVWYIWKGDWYGMPKEKRYSLISGLGGVEQCLKPGRATRIRVAGKDVARASSTGKVELFDR